MIEPDLVTLIHVLQRKDVLSSVDVASIRNVSHLIRILKSKQIIDTFDVLAGKMRTANIARTLLECLEMIDGKEDIEVLPFLTERLGDSFSPAEIETIYHELRKTEDAINPQ